MSAAEDFGNVTALPGVTAGQQFVQVPTDVLDALLRADLAGNERLLALVVIRQTFGYRKLSDDTTIQRLADVAAMDRSAASRAFNGLLDKRVVSADKGVHGYLIKVLPVKFWRVTIRGNDLPQACENHTVVSNHHACENHTTVTVPHARPCENRTHNIEPQYITTPYIPQCGDEGSIPDSGVVAEGNGLTAGVGSDANGDTAGDKRPDRRRSLTLSQYLTQCQAMGREAIPEDDVVWDQAGKLQLPDEWVGLAWLAFKDRFAAGHGARKKSSDWPDYFRRHVVEGWLKLWHLPPGGGQPQLTTAGLQRQALANAAGQG